MRSLKNGINYTFNPGDWEAGVPRILVVVGARFTLFTCGVRRVYAQINFSFSPRQHFGAFDVTEHGLSSFQLNIGRRDVYSSKMQPQHALVVNLSCLLSSLRLQLRPLQMNSKV